MCKREGRKKRAGERSKRQRERNNDGETTSKVERE